MSRRRKYYLQDETGIVYVTWRARELASFTPPTLNAHVWRDHLNNSVWLVNFEVQPATVTSDAGQTVDGWELNDGFFIFISDSRLRVSNNQFLHTPRFVSQPTSATLPLSVNTITGELLHGN